MNNQFRDIFIRSRMSASCESKLNIVRHWNEWLDRVIKYFFRKLWKPGNIFIGLFRLLEGGRDKRRNEATESDVMSILGQCCTMLSLRTTYIWNLKQLQDFYFKYWMTKMGKNGEHGRIWLTYGARKMVSLVSTFDLKSHSFWKSHWKVFY